MRAGFQPPPPGHQDAAHPPWADAGATDAVRLDSGFNDATTPPDRLVSDLELADGNPVDAPAGDLATNDTSFADTGAPDRRQVEASQSDAEMFDADLADAGAADAPATDSPPGDAVLMDSSSSDQAMVDTFIADAVVPDATVPDATSADAATPDTATPDTAAPDTAAPDTASPDSAWPDTALPDSSSPDAARPDSAVTDSGPMDAATGPAIVVDTATDVVNSADGLTSLREAISRANNTPGPQSIRFSGPMTIVLGSTLPNINGAEPLSILGEPGVAIDGTASTTSCFSISSNDNNVSGLKIYNCPTNAIYLTGDRNRVSDCVVHSNQYGVHATGLSNQIGPGVEAHTNWMHGIFSEGVGTVIVGNRSHHNTEVGVRLSGQGGSVTVLGNLIYRNAMVGISVSSGNDDNTLWHNTVANNLDRGVYVENQSTGNDMRNNIFSGQGGWAVQARDASFNLLDYNNYHGNLGGDCSACTPGSGSEQWDPGYQDSAADNYQLSTGSLLIDEGVVLGVDVNGVAPGDFNGSAPDMGAHEAP